MAGGSNKKRNAAAQSSDSSSGIGVAYIPVPKYVYVLSSDEEGNPSMPAEKAEVGKVQSSAAAGRKIGVASRTRFALRAKGSPSVPSTAAAKAKSKATASLALTPRKGLREKDPPSEDPMPSLKRTAPSTAGGKRKAMAKKPKKKAPEFSPLPIMQELLVQNIEKMVNGITGHIDGLSKKVDTMAVQINELTNKVDTLTGQNK